MLRVKGPSFFGMHAERKPGIRAPAHCPPPSITGPPPLQFRIQMRLPLGSDCHGYLQAHGHEATIAFLEDSQHPFTILASMPPVYIYGMGLVGARVGWPSKEQRVGSHPVIVWAAGDSHGYAAADGCFPPISVKS